MIHTTKLFIKSFVIIGFAGFLFQESLSATGLGAIDFEELKRQESATTPPAAAPPVLAALEDLPTTPPQHEAAPQEDLWTQVDASLGELVQATSEVASGAWSGFKSLFKLPSFTVPACLAINLDDLTLGNNDVPGHGDQE